MKLVVGLGNPGKQYEQTKHNVGFWVLDRLAREQFADAWQMKFDGFVTECRLGSDKLLLQKPVTFMNASGRAVRKVVDFYKIPVTDVLVICDDLSLPVGKLRLRPSGSSGGQNGLKDVILHLQTDAVQRLRLGIGERGAKDAVDHVLSQFTKDERSIMDVAVAEAVDAVKLWCEQGMSAAMNQYNGRQQTQE